MKLQRSSVFGLLAQPRVAFFLLCMFGVTRTGVCDGDVESIPGELQDVLPQLQKHFCHGCNGSWTPCKPSESKQCPICSQICPRGSSSNINAECYEDKCKNVLDSLCGVECKICLFGDARICEYDNDDVCVFGQSDRIYCICKNISEILFNKSCIERREELSTPPVTTTMDSPPSQVNVGALALGLVLTMVLVSVVFGVLCFCPKDNLKCKRSKRAADGRKRKAEDSEMPRQPVPQGQAPQGTAMINPTYTVPTEVQGQNQPRLNLGRDSPDKGHNNHAHDGPSVRPSAPPIEYLENNTDVPGYTDNKKQLSIDIEATGHFYYELDGEGDKAGENTRAPSRDEPNADPSESQNQHEYFTLEPQVDNDSGEISETTAAEESTDYNRIKHSPERKDDGSYYSHLSVNHGDDHVSRSGHTLPKEGVVE